MEFILPIGPFLILPKYLPFQLKGSNFRVLKYKVECFKHFYLSEWNIDSWIKGTRNKNLKCNFERFINLKYCLIQWHLKFEFSQQNICCLGDFQSKIKSNIIMLNKVKKLIFLFNLLLKCLLLCGSALDWKIETETPRPVHNHLGSKCSFWNHTCFWSLNCCKLKPTKKP